jgi:hypothetical protein
MNQQAGVAVRSVQDIKVNALSVSFDWTNRFAVMSCDETLPEEAQARARR